jgi:hypothetical protein
MGSETDWLQIINTGGVLGLLLLLVYMFYSGNVVPKSTVDMMIKLTEERTVKLAAEIKEGMKDAVKQGIIEGIHEVRNITER